MGHGILGVVLVGQETVNNDVVVPLAMSQSAQTGSLAECGVLKPRGRTC